MKMSNPLMLSSQSYIYGKIEPLTKEDFYMSDKTKKVVRAISTGVTICGVVGLFVSGASEADVSTAVKVGAMIASIIGSIITTLLPRK